MRRLFSIAAALAVAAVTTSAPGGAARSGTIHGRVEAPDDLPAVARRPSVGELGAPPARGLADRRVSVVYLETAPATALDRPTRRAAIDQRNETFMPHVLAVTAGTTVEFPNNDATYHNVFSLSRVTSFDLGRYAQGRSKSVQFDRPGIVRVFCDIHSHMSAFVLVFNHGYFAMTAPDGSYRINDVPPGEYGVAVWNELMDAVPVAVDVPSAGGDHEVNFVLHRK